MVTSRIPRYEDQTIGGMKAWFSAMARQDLLFHPDDAPEQMVSVRTGQRLFSQEECGRVQEVLERMFEHFGDKVYDAAYPVFMREFRALIKH